MDEILALVRRKMAEYRVPGVGLGLWHDQALHLHGLGVTSLDDPRPITADTLFTIASISKTMTATAVMRLVEQGRLDLHAPVRKALPEFQVRDEAVSASVTPWHLLTHTPGWEGQLTTEDRGAEALAHFVSTIMPALPQLAPPGRVWSYNNAGFALSGRLLEVVTGRAVHDALRELVFAPLGLSRTFTRLTEAMTYPGHARPPRPRRRHRGDSSVPDDVEHDRGRGADVAERPDALRALPPRGRRPRRPPTCRARA